MVFNSSKSIQKRLTVLLLTIIIIVGVTTLSISYYDTTHEVNELFDAQLAQSARVLHAQITSELKDNEITDLQGFLDYRPKLTIPFREVDTDQTSHEYERQIGFQLWDHTGKLILHSKSVGETPLSETALRPGKSGFDNTMEEGHQWRVFSIWDEEHHYVVMAGESYNIRQELVVKISWQLVAPYLISIPIMAMLIWLGIERGLNPIIKVANEVRQRESKNLHPIEFTDVPKEILPLIQNLNDLFSRLNEAFEKERRFTNDAAHELRTPLAALKTHAQVALRETNQADRNTALTNIIAGVNRASHLVEQMLTLARMSPDQNILQDEDVKIYQVLEEVAADLSQYAFKKGITLSLDGDRKMSIKTNAVILSILVRNILDNAISYTPEGGDIDIELLTQGEYPVIRITDTGPGISEDLQGRVFDRFFRLPGSQNEGCGLGLSIATQCANNLNAEIILKNRAPTGLVVTVEFKQPVS